MLITCGLLTALHVRSTATDRRVLLAPPCGISSAHGVSCLSVIIPVSSCAQITTTPFCLSMVCHATYKQAHTHSHTCTKSIYTQARTCEYILEYAFTITITPTHTRTHAHTHTHTRAHTHTHTHTHLNQSVHGCTQPHSQVYKEGEASIWVKPLSDGRMAALLFNEGSTPIDIFLVFR